jgi:hypothetical protein
MSRTALGGNKVGNRSDPASGTGAHSPNTQTQEACAWR